MVLSPRRGERGLRRRLGEMEELLLLLQAELELEVSVEKGEMAEPRRSASPIAVSHARPIVARQGKAGAAHLVSDLASESVSLPQLDVQA
jgi:hypothetical protein